MRTVVLGEQLEVTEWIARRRALGQDRHDEVWDGEYHVAPSPNRGHAIVVNQLSAALTPLARARGLWVSVDFNLGATAHDYRCPDLGVHRESTPADWVPTAAMVVEVVSPHDESWRKFDHYAAHGVDEVLIADPATNELWLFALAGDEYQPSDASAVLGVSVAELGAAVDWP